MKLKIVLLVLICILMTSCYKKAEFNFEDYTGSSPNSFTHEEYKDYSTIQNNKTGQSNSAYDYYYLAQSSFKNQQYENSVNYYNKMLEILPDNRFGHYGKCLALIELKQYHLAISSCSQSLKINSLYSHAYVNRGMAYYHIGEIELALNDFNLALEIYPEAFIYDNRGQVYLHKKNYNSAIENFEKAIHLEADFKLSHWNLAMAYALQNQCRKAEDFINQACQLGLNQACQSNCQKMKETFQP